MVKIKSQIWIEVDGRLIFSDGRMALLEAVEKLGSLRKAAALLGMSYRAAWGLLKVTEEALGIKLLDVRIGGRNGGGSRLTPEARDLMRRYRRIKRAVDRKADSMFARVFQLR